MEQLLGQQVANIRLIGGFGSRPGLGIPMPTGTDLHRWCVALLSKSPGVLLALGSWLGLRTMNQGLIRGDQEMAQSGLCLSTDVWALSLYLFVQAQQQAGNPMNNLNASLRALTNAAKEQAPGFCIVFVALMGAKGLGLERPAQ